jgi:hypothetical protein
MATKKSSSGTRKGMQHPAFKAQQKPKATAPAPRPPFRKKKLGRSR